MNNKIFSLIVLSVLFVFNVEAGIINKRSDPTVVRSIIWIDSDLYFENRDEITRYCTRFDVADLKFNDKYFICNMNEKFYTYKNKNVIYTNYQDDCIKGQLIPTEYNLNDVYEVSPDVMKNCNKDIFNDWHYYIVDKYDKINTKTVKALPKNVSSVSTTTTVSNGEYLPPIMMSTTSKTLPKYTSTFSGNNYLPNVPFTYPTKSLGEYITTTTSKTIPTTTSLPNPNDNYLPNVPTTYSSKTIYITTTTSKTIPTTTSLPEVLPYITTTSKTLPTTTVGSDLPNASDFLNQNTVTVTVTSPPEIVTVTVTNRPKVVTVTVNNTPETVTITEKETETVTTTITSECLQPIQEPKQDLNQTNVGPTDDNEESSEDEEGCVELYGQCGGVDYKGPTCCRKGHCAYFHEYYSQCIDY